MEDSFQLFSESAFICVHLRCYPIATHLFPLWITGEKPVSKSTLRIIESQGSLVDVGTEKIYERG
jgi:hypothetical protein